MNKTFIFSRRQQEICLVFMLLGILALGFSFAGPLPERAWANFLLNAIYFLTVAIFAVFFLALETLTGAYWSKVFCRIPQAITSFIPVGGALLLLTLVGVPHLYGWTHVGSGHGHFDKHLYLNVPFFAMRMVLIIGLWWWFARGMRREERTVKVAALFIVCFALSFAVATYDWLMSLEPHWFSTVFSVYHFAGVFVAGIAVIALMVIILNEMKVLKEINENHIHDLGKYLFAFSMFWAYIWYCQFMLIWYGNMPEETVYFVHRLKDDWSWLFYFNFFLNFVVPFFVLLPRQAKRSRAMVFRVAIVLLIGHWLDLYLMIMPPVTGAASNIGFVEVATALGFAGAFTFTVGHALAKRPILPPSTPMLNASLHHYQ